MLLILERIIRLIISGGKMYRNLYKNEQYWVKKILEVEFKGKQFLMEQISKAKVILEEGYSFISLKFKTENTNRYPYPVRVPVEMRAFQKNSAPIVFLLHVVNGFIDELELITADSSKIDSASITLDNVEYVVNEQVK